MIPTITEDFKIETDRLLLIPISSVYRDDIFREFTEEVARYLLPQPTGNINDTTEFIVSSSAKNMAGDGLQLVAIDKNTKEFMACVGLHKIKTSVPELGLWFKKSVWGQGYGKEAMVALKKWADENLDYEKIRYPVYKANVPSRKIAEFLGGVVERELITQDSRGRDFEEVEYFIPRTKF